MWSENDIPLSTAQKLDDGQTRVPIGGKISALSLKDEKWNLEYAEMRFHWRTIGSGDLLMFALPHQVDTMVWQVDTANNVHYTIDEADESGATKTNLKFNVLRGL